MNWKPIVRNVALMVLFGVIGLGQFSENVRTVQVIGLFFSGAVCGASLAGLITVLRRRQQQS